MKSQLQKNNRPLIHEAAWRGLLPASVSNRSHDARLASLPQAYSVQCICDDSQLKETMRHIWRETGERLLRR